MDSNLLDDENSWHELEKSQQYLDDVGLQLTPNTLMSPRQQMNDSIRHDNSMSSNKAGEGGLGHFET